MNIAKCRLCGNKIPKWTYSNALYCGDTCRKRYWDITHRPKHNKTASKLIEDVVEIENEDLDNGER